MADLLHLQLGYIGFRNDVGYLEDLRSLLLGTLFVNAVRDICVGPFQG